MTKQYDPLNMAVIGMELGDEGKGKIVDFLAEKADNCCKAGVFVLTCD